MDVESCIVPVAGALMTMVTLLAPGGIVSAEHVTVPFDCEQFQPVPDAETNWLFDGNASVSTMPEPKS